MQHPPGENSLDNLACPTCAKPFPEDACTEAIDYWDSVADIRCENCGTDCHITTKVTRTATIELVDHMPYPPAA